MGKVEIKYLARKLFKRSSKVNETCLIVNKIKHWQESLHFSVKDEECVSKHGWVRFTKYRVYEDNGSMNKGEDLG